MKVLIVKVSALGDIVHALPVVDYLNSVDPQMSVDWLVEEGFAPLLEAQPLIRKVHHLRTKAWRREGLGGGFRGIRKIVRDLRRESYDVVLDLQGNSKSGLFTFLAGAPRRFGFAREGVREWPNFAATNRKVVLGADDYHITARALAVARAAFPGGAEPRRSGFLPVPETARRKVAELLEEHAAAAQDLVVLHYGTTWDTKLWALESWQRLAAQLCRDPNVRPVLTWGNDRELEAAGAIAHACNGAALIWPRGTLPELIALLERATLVIGGDTGPVHIAAAVGTPTVSLYRVTDAERNGPRGERDVRLQAPLDCSPCLRRECERDELCSRSIAVEAVEKAARRALGREAA